VCIEARDDVLRVEISDRGRGLVVRNGDAGGLRGLSDRLEALGGSLSVVGTPPDGTRLVGTLPARERGDA